ncbi:MAG: hypothetical protein FJ011_26295 [Chloroflexi bacterium]|nr:hypothetical protein [Chloroflexota bacterium]
MLEYRIQAVAGRCDGDSFIDFTAYIYDTIEDEYVDDVAGIIWVTGAGVAFGDGVVPVQRSIGIRWAEHTLHATYPVVGAQIVVRLHGPHGPERVASELGVTSGTSEVQLFSEVVNVILYR